VEELGSGVVGYERGSRRSIPAG